MEDSNLLYTKPTNSNVNLTFSISVLNNTWPGIWVPLLSHTGIPIHPLHELSENPALEET